MKHEMQEWLLEKIKQFLTIKEGCTVTPLEGAGSTVLVQDVFGFRYEITVRPAGRIQLDAIDNLGLRSKLASIKNGDFYE